MDTVAVTGASPSVVKNIVSKVIKGIVIVGVVILTYSIGRKLYKILHFKLAGYDKLVEAAVVRKSKHIHRGSHKEHKRSMEVSEDEEDDESVRSEDSWEGVEKAQGVIARILAERKALRMDDISMSSGESVDDVEEDEEIGEECIIEENYEDVSTEEDDVMEDDEEETEWETVDKHTQRKTSLGDPAVDTVVDPAVDPVVDPVVDPAVDPVNTYT